MRNESRAGDLSIFVARLAIWHALGGEVLNHSQELGLRSGRQIRHVVDEPRRPVRVLALPAPPCYACRGALFNPEQLRSGTVSAMAAQLAATKGRLQGDRFLPVDTATDARIRLGGLIGGYAKPLDLVAIVHLTRHSSRPITVHQHLLRIGLSRTRGVFVGDFGSPLTFRQQVILLAAIGLLGVIVAVSLMATSITARRARTAIVHQLQRLSPHYEVRLNGRVIENGAPVLNSIRRVTTAWEHHSHPTTPIVIEVTDGERRMKIIIAKDSEVPDEYWIYRPGSNMENDPLGQYIGRVRDPQLTAQLATLVAQ